MTIIWYRINGRFFELNSGASPSSAPPEAHETFDTLAEYNAAKAAATQPQPKPAQFRQAMMVNQGYLRIRQIAKSLNSPHIDFVELAIVAQPSNFDVLVTQWNALISSLSPGQLPSPSEVAQWQAYATATHMPFSFNSDGTASMNP